MHLRELREVKASDGVSILFVSDIQLNWLLPNVQKCLHNVSVPHQVRCVAVFAQSRAHVSKQYFEPFSL